MEKTSIHFALAALLVLGGFLACGGSGGGGAAQDSTPPNPAPVIHAFTVEPTAIQRGAKAWLLADFANGRGRVSPEVGDINKLEPRDVGPLADTVYTLTVVDGHGRSVTRDVTLRVLPDPDPALPPLDALKISAAGEVAANQRECVASLPVLADCGYAWTFENAEAIPPTDTPSVKFNVGAGGEAKVTCTLAFGPEKKVIPITMTVKVAAAPLPPRITRPEQVTANQGGYVASLPFQPGCKYQWEPGNGRITSGNDGPSMTFTAGLSGETELSCVITDALGQAGAPVKASCRIVPEPATPLPTVQAHVKPGQAYTASVPDQDGCAFAWHCTGGKFPAGNKGRTVSFVPEGTGSAILQCVAMNAAGTYSKAGQVTCAIVQDVPPSAVTAPAKVTAGKSGYTASVPTQPGFAYAWSIEHGNGSILAGAGTPAVTFTAGAGGMTRLLCAITDAAGVAAQAAPAECAVLPLPPRPAVKATDAVTENDPNVSAWVNPQAGCSYHWSVGGGTITAGGGGPKVTCTAGPAGKMVLSCRIANALGDSELPGLCEVTVLPAPIQPVVTAAPAAIEGGQAACVASVPAKPGITHVWSVSGATPTTGLTGDSVTFTAGPSGSVTLGCMAGNALGVQSAQGTLTRAIVPLPAQPAITGTPAFVTAGATGLKASVALQACCSYAWTSTPGGLITAGGATGQVSYDAPAAGTVGLACTVTNSLGTASAPGTATLTVVPPPVSQGFTPPMGPLVGEQSGYLATTAAPPAGCTLKWTVTNGTLESADSLTTLPFKAGESGFTTLALAVVNQAGTVSPTPTATIHITPQPKADASAFLKNGKPYLQLGSSSSPSTLSLVWMAEGKQPSVPEDWVVEVMDGSPYWDDQSGLSFKSVDFGNLASEPVHRVFTQPLTGLPPGGTFWYRVRLAGKTVFQNQGRALKAPGQKQVVAIAGDLVSGDHAPTRRVVDQIMLKSPDLMVVPGDMVNLEGHANQYRNALFSIYNTDAQGPTIGAPLMRNIPLVGCLGNNDTDRVLEPRTPGWPQPKVAGPPTPARNGLAYYYYFDLPLNGPVLTINDGNTPQPATHTPYLHPKNDFNPFLDAAGARYLRMNNFSFDSGDIHWVVLDSNYYMNWSDPNLQLWLTSDLAGSTAIWKVVVFHYPVFNLATWYRTYREDEGSRMRQLWPIFAAHGVDLTFSGHIHTYQRTRPFTFTGPLTVTPASAPIPGFPTYPDSALVEDTVFTGNVGSALPNGVISIISGGGGAHLRNMTQKTFHGPDPGHHPVRFFGNEHGFSMLETERLGSGAKKLTFEHFNSAGTSRDRFMIVKP